MEKQKYVSYGFQYYKHIIISGIGQTKESMHLDLKRKPVEISEVQVKCRITNDSKNCYMI